MVEFRDKLMFLHGAAFAAAWLGCDCCRERLVDEVAAALFISTHRPDARSISEAFGQLLRAGGFNQDLRRDN
jgi:hypothetical protein